MVKTFKKNFSLIPKIKKKMVEPKKPRKRAAKYRHHVITTHDTKKFKLWKKLDIDDLQIRSATFQLEPTKKGGIHVQAYFEFYDQLRISQVKERLQDNTLHSEPRKGTRVQARDYCLKDNTPYFEVNYPEWSDHGGRIPGTDSVQLGKFRVKQGHRTDLDQVSECIKDGKTEAEIFESCPAQYIKYSTGIRRARNLLGRSRLNTYHPITVHVLWGDTRSNKTRTVLDKYGPQNVYSPVWSASAQKFWFNDYDGQKILLINEFYGQARTAIMQQLLDHYRMSVESKGDTVISNWDKIYITSNCHPKDWYSGWANIPEKVQDSFIERIKTIKFMPSMKKKIKTWDDIPEEEIVKVEAPVLPSTTSEPRAPGEGEGSTYFELFAKNPSSKYASICAKKKPR